MTVHFISKGPYTLTDKRSFRPEISFVELKKHSFFEIIPHRSRCIKDKSFHRFSNWPIRALVFSTNEEAKILSGFENLTNDAMPGGACTFNILGLSDRMTPCICCDVTGDIIQGDVTIKRRNKSVLRHFIILFLCIFQKYLLRAC